VGALVHCGRHLGWWPHFGTFPGNFAKSFGLSYTQTSLVTEEREQTLTPEEPLCFLPEEDESPKPRRERSCEDSPATKVKKFKQVEEKKIDFLLTFVVVSRSAMLL